MVFLAKVFLPSLLVVGSLAAPQLALGGDFNADLNQELEGPFDPNPVYTYSYQVANDEEQTYIAHNEDRDGDEVTGQYSYVDPLGSLVTVTYSAGPGGYTEERNVQDGFVTIRSSNSGASLSSSSSSASSGAAIATQTAVTTTQTQSSTSNEDLLAEIIARLRPFIQESVAGALSSQRTTTTTRVVQPRVETIETVAVPVRVAPAPAPAASSVTNIFGEGGANNVRFSAPEFNYAFDLDTAPAN